MHELSIAENVLEAVKAEVQRRPGARVLKVGMKLGELSGVEPDSLSFCFECLTKGTDLDSLQLEIERCPRQQRCPACNKDFRVVDYSVTCPTCGSTQTQHLGGEELEIAYLELEES